MYPAARFTVMQNARELNDAGDGGGRRAPLPNDYVYNVFVSYNYASLMRRWVNGSFKELFEYFLANELNVRDPQVGFFADVVRAGQHWRNRLGGMLLRSRVLVAVCSPGYFRSGWCLSEWESFRLREELLQCDGLRVPLLHDDGQHYMTQHGVDGIHHVDFRDCAFFVGDPNQHPKGPMFEEKVHELAAAVAEQVTNAPPFDPGWPLAEMPDVPTPNTTLKRIDRS